MKNQLKKGIYVLTDLEMTGLNPFEHGVIEVGIMILDAQFSIIEDFVVDLCPPKSKKIDMDALVYNGFTLDRIAKGQSYTAFIEQCIALFDAYFDLKTHKPIFVGQYVTADIMFLASIFHETGNMEYFLKLGNDILDTKSFANQYNAIARYSHRDLPYPSTSLSKPGGLADSFHIDRNQAHTARGDMIATKEVLIKFLGL